MSQQPNTSESRLIRASQDEIDLLRKYRNATEFGKTALHTMADEFAQPDYSDLANVVSFKRPPFPR